MKLLTVDDIYGDPPDLQKKFKSLTQPVNKLLAFELFEFLHCLNCLGKHVTNLLEEASLSTHRTPLELIKYSFNLSQTYCLLADTLVCHTFLKLKEG